MQVTILSDDPDVKQALLNADPSATIVDRPMGGVLKADLSTKAAVALVQMPNWISCGPTSAGGRPMAALVAGIGKRLRIPLQPI
jgi:hypothetical protein